MTSGSAGEGPLDVELMIAVSKGDHGAFDRLYRRHAATVLRCAWGLAATRDDAEELVQETFITLWRRRRDSIIYEDSTLPWLLATCRNHWQNEQRRRIRKATLPLDAAAESAADDEDRVRWIRDELDRLSPADRRLCELVLVEGCSYKEAAAELDLSIAAAAKRLERAKSRLREEIASHGD